MYAIVRIIIGGIFFLLGYSLIKKSKSNKKRALRLVLCIVTTLLITVLSLLPFENLFITFDSPEEAIEYYNFRKSNIKLIVEGNECDLIVEDIDSDLIYSYIPKTNNGWKIGVGLNSKTIFHTITSAISVNVFQYRDTTDYFVMIRNHNLKNADLDLSDNYDSVFYSLEEYDDSLRKLVTYYAHIPNFNSGYTITVNGEKIVLN